jgi:hypothetical protein
MKILNQILVFMLLLFSISAVYAQTDIGKTVFARGITMAESDSGVVRVLSEGETVYEGDTLTTGEKSFAVLELNDGSKMSLRPNTTFQLENFKLDKNKADVRLFTGGLRAKTGTISKENPEGFKLHANDTSTTVRDAEFDVRLCQDECEEEAAKHRVQQESKKLVVGRVAEVQGQLTITDTQKYSRIAVKGAPLYEGDSVVSGVKAYAVLAFRDKGRVTIQEETTFKIEKLQFEESQPTEGNAIFGLIQGGLRALTGAIGNKDKEDYQMNTPVATIGIRGTGFDLVCVENCVNPNSKQITDVGALGIGDGLYANVWEGAIIIQTAVGKLILEKGGVVIVPSNESEPKTLPKLPPFLDDNPAPRPDEITIDHDNLFATFPIKQYRFGLFLAVYKGHLTIVQDEKRLDLGIEEASGYDIDRTGDLLRLERIPPLLEDDPYFKIIDENYRYNYDSLDENFDDFFECTIQ